MAGAFRRSIRPVVVAMTAGAMFASPSPALASLTLGSPLTDSVGCCASAGSLQVQTQLPGAFLFSSVDGTIVRWRIRGTVMNAFANTFRLRVVAAVGDGTFNAAGTSAVVRTPNAASDDVIRTFATRLPIRSGEQLGITGGASSQFPSANSITGADVEFYTATADGFNSGAPITHGSGDELLFNADVVGLPTSSAAVVPPCTVVVTVTADPDPATGPKAVHYRLDGGTEQVRPVVGSSASIQVPPGHHSLEYWGEDLLGQQEKPHHVLQVTGNCPLPKISSAHLSRKTFTAANTGGSVAKVSTGTTIRYHLSQAALVTFTVLKRVTGHKHNGKCLKGRPHNKQKPCPRYKPIGAFTSASPAGKVKVHFPGRVNGKKLGPGKYVLALTPGSGVLTGRTVRLKFQIVA